MQIKEIAFKNFRSIGDQGLILDGLGRFNLFIGKNNSGKSNIIKVVPLLNDLLLACKRRRGGLTFGADNSIVDPKNLFYRNDRGLEIILSVTFGLEDEERKGLLNGLEHGGFKMRLLATNHLTVEWRIGLKANNQNLDYRIALVDFGGNLLLDENKKILKNRLGLELKSEEYSAVIDNLAGGADVSYINSLLAELSTLLKDTYLPEDSKSF